MPHVFKDVIRMLLDGANVDSATFNRVFRELDNNLQYLKDWVDTSLASKGIFAREVTCEEGLLVGQPAWYNPATQRFERAKAVISADNSNGLLTVAGSSYAVGLVSFKQNSTKCDILLAGVMELDLSNAIAGTITDGIYSVSAIEAGKLQKSDVIPYVPVAQVMGDLVFVRANLADIFSRHVHHNYELICAPAGVPQLDGRWTIEDSDSEMEGWLPADDAIFDGNAPEGAVFGYNIAASGLADVWPPLPVTGAGLFWDRGAGVGATLVPEGPEGLVIIDEFGIWWMSDCAASAPWPFSDGELMTTTTEPDCPIESGMRMTLNFVKTGAVTSSIAVLSLTPGSDIVQITCKETGDEATTGNLVINVDISLLMEESTSTAGYVALKELTTDGKFKRGKVVESIKSSSESLLVAGSEELGDGSAVGKIVLTAFNNPLGAELSVQNVQLDGAQLEYPDENMAILFEADRNSGLVGELHVPSGLSGIASANVKVRAWIMGDAAGTLPPMTLTARVLNRPSGSPVAIPTTDSAVTFDSEVAVGTNEYVEVESANISATPGASIQFSLSREAEGGDGYDGGVYLVKLLGRIASVVTE